MKLSPILFLVFITVVLPSHAQCVLDPVHSTSVEGYLLYGYAGRYRIINPANVLICKWHDGLCKKPVAKVTVDENGYFSVKQIKPGSYILCGKSEALYSACVDIQVLPPNKSKEPESDLMILIVLGADLSECGGSSITIQSRSTINAMLH